MKVLVVDDDPGSLLVAKAAVERSGHECLTAADGDAAWRLYQSDRPQAVVTDLMMPDSMDWASAGPSGPLRRTPPTHI
jgi:CheY-like chemotaxis protein